jgi:hypothetical protein
MSKSSTVRRPPATAKKAPWETEDTPAQPAAPQAFAPFAWVREENQTPDYPLLEFAYDVVAGISLSLQLIEASDNARGTRQIPVLTITQCGTLQRYAISSSRLLAESIEARFGDLNRGGEA